MIQLVEGFWCDPFDVMVVKAIGKDKCALWMTGQNATEGFVLDYPASEVVEAVMDERDNYEEE